MRSFRSRCSSRFGDIGNRQPHRWRRDALQERRIEPFVLLDVPSRQVDDRRRRPAQRHAGDDRPATVRVAAIEIATPWMSATKSGRRTATHPPRPVCAGAYSAYARLGASMT
jgi:hypothetical protein